MRLVRFVYISSAIRPFSEDELVHLLRTARQRNARRGVTGMLLYEDGNFMQVLEGPETAVKALAAKIERDPRHRQFIALLKEPIQERLFPAWQMGFRRIDRLTEQDEDGVTHFLSASLTADTFQDRPDRAWKLLKIFRDTTR